MVECQEEVMKKVIALILLLSLFLVCGCTSASNETGKEAVNIQKLSISCTCSEANAGESFEVVLFVNNEKTDFDDVSSIQLVFSKGWDNVEFKNGRVYIKNDAENDSEIEFYAKSGNISSNTLKVHISNEEQVKQQQIAEYEDKIDELEKEIEQYNKEKTELQTQLNNATSEFYSYESYCEASGYSVNGNWKVPSSSSVRIQYDKLYATMNEYYILLSKKQSQIASAQTAISTYQNKIKELQ